MAYEITRRDFLKYAVGVAGIVGGLGAIATYGFAQAKQPSSNASRKFLDVLINNLHTPKVYVNPDGSYTVRNHEGEGHKEYFTVTYNLGKGDKQESLVVYVDDYNDQHTTLRARHYRFENTGLQDMPTRVIERTREGKEVPFDVKSLPKPLQEAHRKAYERALGVLSIYLSSAPAKAKHKK